ncbi:MAG: hypothetical protein NTW46_03325 [Candidatus Nealsonbacteria bacterium]|nr:hypothetical protein [Candidatus Nealsonbacteria bacterium]
MKNEKEKTLLIEQLKKMPIVEIAVNKAGISRATFYRWKKDDPEFAKEIGEALLTGKSMISDVAESQLISAIKTGDMRGITFWLTHNKNEYRNKIELSGSLSQIREDLTEDEAKILRQVLKLAGFKEAKTKK